MASWPGLSSRAAGDTGKLLSLSDMSGLSDNECDMDADSEDDDGDEDDDDEDDDDDDESDEVSEDSDSGEKSEKKKRKMEVSPDCAISFLVWVRSGTFVGSDSGLTLLWLSISRVKTLHVSRF